MKYIKTLLLSLGLSLFLSFSVAAQTNSSFFAESNFVALQKDPLTLFSKANTCFLKALLGKEDFNFFHESMSLMTDEEDEPNFLAISGNVKGLFTIYEGFIRISKTGKIWIAYLYDGKVHYFTNDKDTLNQPPKIMLTWSKRFEDAKWIPKLLEIKADNCK